jgi:arylsulfatase A-like enzyme
VIRDPEPRPGDLTRVALWCGLLTGLGEATLMEVERLVRHKFLFLSPDFLWMTPLADALVVGAGALLLLTAHRLGRGRVGVQFVLWTIGFLTALSPLFRLPSLHPWARLVLALGIGYQFARLARPRISLLGAVARATLPWMLVLLAAVGIGRYAGLSWQERRARRLLPSASPGAPNILLIILDTVRSADLSLYGYHRATTPFLERFASRGVVFDHAFATAPWTLPSHASMFTGRLPHEHGADWRVPLDGRYPVLAEALAARGYATAGFVGNTLYCAREKGLARGFTHYEDFLLAPGELLRSNALLESAGDQKWLRRLIGTYQLPARKSADRVNAEVLSWLGHRPDRPVFVFVNYFDAHDPLIPPAPFDRRFGPVGADREALQRRMLDAGHNNGVPPKDLMAIQLDLYDGAIAYLDGRVESLLDSLDRRGLLENTLVVVTSDHGNLFGEHDESGHGFDLYRQSLEVPLMLSLPGRLPAGKRIDTAVSLRDLASTLYSFAGGNGSPFPGRSLERFWVDHPPNGPAGGDTLVMELSNDQRLPSNTRVSLGDMASVLVDRYRLIQNGDGSEELFDWTQDPLEASNLARSDSLAPDLERLRWTLRSLVPARGAHPGAGAVAAR